jgi:hypothetical protein
MNWHIPQLKDRHRLYGIGYAALLLFWLSAENQSVWLVSLLGVGLSLILIWLGGLYWFGGRSFSPNQWIPGLIVAGAVVGCGAVLCAVGLMVFKNGWHAHAFPDFPGTVVAGMGRRLIPWTLAGALIGGAVALLRVAGLSETQSPNTR